MSIKMIVFDFRGSEEEFFKRNKLENFDITFITGTLNDESVLELPQKLRDSVQVVSVFIESEITSHVIGQFKNLLVISTRSTGVDHINLRSCQKRNIAVLNVERYGSTSVAQYTLGLIIALIRHIPAATQYMKSETRHCTEFVGRDLTKLTLGVIGTGATGAVVAKTCEFIGMKVLGFDLFQKKELNIEYTDFETLIKTSDVLTLHLPYTGNNQHMISKDQLNMMKPDAYFINTSRGELVKTVDLYDVMSKGHLKGAALDVLPCESYNFACAELEKHLPPQSCAAEVKAARNLAALPNVIITPHIAYETQDAIDYILEETFTGVMNYFTGNNTHRVV